MSSTRVQAGVPAGGQFSPQTHTEPDVALSSDNESSAVCSECGAATKRTSGLCRRCDPKAKKARDSRPARGASNTRGVERDRPTGPVLDREAGSLTVDQIGQCEFGFVPVYRSGAKLVGATRGCKNAVIIRPGTDPLCHQHGGATETSLGRTVAKATAEAGRGECFPLAAEHWDAVDQRLAAAQGRLLGMLDTDTSKLAQAFVAWRNQQGDTPSRFSTNNQLLVLIQHYENASRSGLSDDEAWDAAVAASAEPHQTKAGWARLGREPDDDAQGVAVVWWQPGSSAPKQAEGESDEDFEKRVEGQPGWRGRHGALIQFPLSATSGDDYEMVEDPLASARPTGFGDAPSAIGTMSGLASDMGIEVDLVDRQPASGAMGFWSASESKIVVWSGVGGGDERAVAHVLAHELGHARLGHSTDASNESRTAEKEVAAESFAALVCSHHGIDASEVSAFYIDHWRENAGVNMKAAGFGPVRSAVAAFDDYVTATTPSVASDDLGTPG